MTSYFVEKDKRVILYDTYVIVDNYVEIGDFFPFFTFFVKIGWMFYSRKLQENNFRIKKILM